MPSAADHLRGALVHVPSAQRSAFLAPVPDSDLKALVSLREPLLKPALDAEQTDRLARSGHIRVTPGGPVVTDAGHMRVMMTIGDNAI